jgi:hypothetical protein
VSAPTHKWFHARFLTLGYYFHAAIVTIPDPAAQAVSMRYLHAIVTEPHSLHPAGNHEMNPYLHFRYLTKWLMVYGQWLTKNIYGTPIMAEGFNPRTISVTIAFRPPHVQPRMPVPKPRANALIGGPAAKLCVARFMNHQPLSIWRLRLPHAIPAIKVRVKAVQPNARTSP